LAVVPINIRKQGAAMAFIPLNLGNFNTSKEPLSTSLKKVNDMIEELYTFSEEGDLGSISQNIVPDQDNLRDLGSADKKWRSLYVSGNTIYLGNSEISVDNQGNLSVNGESIAATTWENVLGRPDIPTSIFDLDVPEIIIRPGFLKYDGSNLNWIEIAAVAESGNYDDLSNKPVLFSGSYNDLTDKPTIPDLTGVSQNIVPNIDNTYSLGSAEKQWKDIFVSNGSVYIGDVKLSNDSGTLRAIQVADPGLETEQEIRAAFPSNNISGSGTGATVTGIVIPTALGTNIFRAIPSNISMYNTALVGPVASVTISPPVDLTIGLGGGTEEITSATVPHVSDFFSFGFNFVNKIEYIEDEVTAGGKTYILAVTSGNVSWSSTGPEDLPEVISADSLAGTVTFDRPITWTGSFGVTMGRQAVGEATIISNVVVGVDITDPGWGYGNTYCSASSNIIVQENGALDDPPGNGHQILYKTSLQTTRLAGLLVGNPGQNYKNPILKIQSQDLPSPGLDINGFAVNQTVPVKFNITDGFITNVTLTGGSPVIQAIFNNIAGDWFGNNDLQSTLVVEDGEVTPSPAIEFNNGTIFTGSYNELTDIPIIPTDVADLTDSTNLLGQQTSRIAVAGVTGPLFPNQTGNIIIPGFSSYAILKITTEIPAWVRIYSDQASRTADASRTENQDPAPGAGVIAEVITTGPGEQTVLMTPMVMGFNNEDPVTNNIFVAVTNKGTGLATIEVTLTILKLED